MITQQEMFNPMLEVAKGFVPVWEEFIEEWKEEKELLQYLALSELARYISDLIKKEEKEELKGIFEVIERWHIEGDCYVKEAATVGILEDLQNTNIVGAGIPEIVKTYLLPESKKWWLKVYDFWEKGKIISE
ncbi:MAG: hypothetical protein V7722_09960 [Porticoccus sp.]